MGATMPDFNGGRCDNACMNLLAIETATENCSVALLHGDVLIDRSEHAPRRHAERVLPMAAELLAEAGIARTQLDGIAVGRGPGAFTGVRLAVSLAQGIAYALDRPVVPVSTLAALAVQAPAANEAVLSLLDARMGEVYAGAFVRQPDGLVTALDAEQVCAPEALALPAMSSWCVVGHGWHAHAEALQARLAGVSWEIVSDAVWPQARDVARLAAPRLARGEGVEAKDALPVYLRDKVALTMAERGFDTAGQRAQAWPAGGEGGRQP